MESYRPLSILPVIAGILEKLPSKEVTMFLDQFLSKCQCSFWKSYIAEEYLCGSFLRAAPFVEHHQRKIYYKFQKEEDQIVFSHMVSFYNTGV